MRYIYNEYNIFHDCIVEPYFHNTNEKYDVFEAERQKRFRIVSCAMTCCAETFTLIHTKYKFYTICTYYYIRMTRRGNTVLTVAHNRNLQHHSVGIKMSNSLKSKARRRAYSVSIYLCGCNA